MFHVSEENKLHPVLDTPLDDLLETLYRPALQRISSFHDQTDQGIAFAQAVISKNPCRPFHLDGIRAQLRFLRTAEKINSDRLRNVIGFVVYAILRKRQFDQPIDGGMHAPAAILRMMTATRIVRAKESRLAVRPIDETSGRLPTDPFRCLARL